jgi:hypothetical protein
MSLLVGDIITNTNVLADSMSTTITKVSDNDALVSGSNILNVDFVKYYLAKQMKKRGMVNCRINDRSLHKILTDPIIRRHYKEKKSEKHHH